MGYWVIGSFNPRTEWRDWVSRMGIVFSVDSNVPKCCFMVLFLETFTAVLEASKDLSKSRHLKKLLEIVLALGNYMNRGQRGNASGFRIVSLNKIGDTKSSLNKRVTLLHYLTDIIEQKVSSTNHSSTKEKVVFL